jgi:hypothetical protein
VRRNGGGGGPSSGGGVGKGNRAANRPYSKPSNAGQSVAAAVAASKHLAPNADKLVVSNLAYSVTERDVKDLFSQIGGWRVWVWVSHGAAVAPPHTNQPHPPTHPQGPSSLPPSALTRRGDRRAWPPSPLRARGMPTRP